MACLICLLFISLIYVDKTKGNTISHLNRSMTNAEHWSIVSIFFCSASIYTATILSVKWKTYRRNAATPRFYDTINRFYMRRSLCVDGGWGQGIVRVSVFLYVCAGMCVWQRQYAWRLCKLNYVKLWELCVLCVYNTAESLSIFMNYYYYYCV